MVCSLRCQHCELQNESRQKARTLGLMLPLWGAMMTLARVMKSKEKVTVEARIWFVDCGWRARLAAVAAAQRKRSRQRSTLDGRAL